MSAHERRIELDGTWFVPWCTCGWRGEYAAVSSRASAQWADHEAEACEKSRPPGPPSPPITPGANGWPGREKLNALVATLGIFEWCEANGLLDAEMGELRRARDAFMFDWGATAERWREQTGEEPSWSQYAYLIEDNKRLREGAMSAQARKEAHP